MPNELPRTTMTQFSGRRAGKLVGRGIILSPLVWHSFLLMLLVANSQLTQTSQLASAPNPGIKIVLKEVSIRNLLNHEIEQLNRKLLNQTLPKLSIQKKHMDLQINNSVISDIYIDPKKTYINLLGNNQVEIAFRLKNFRIQFQYNFQSYKIFKLRDRGFFEAYDVVLKYRFALGDKDGRIQIQDFQIVRESNGFLYLDLGNSLAKVLISNTINFICQEMLLFGKFFINYEIKHTVANLNKKIPKDIPIPQLNLTLDLSLTQGIQTKKGNSLDIDLNGEFHQTSQPFHYLNPATQFITNKTTDSFQLYFHEEVLNSLLYQLTVVEQIQKLFSYTTSPDITPTMIINTQTLSPVFPQMAVYSGHPRTITVKLEEVSEAFVPKARFVDSDCIQFDFTKQNVSIYAGQDYYMNMRVSGFAKIGLIQGGGNITAYIIDISLEQFEVDQKYIDQEFIDLDEFQIMIPTCEKLVADSANGGLLYSHPVDASKLLGLSVKDFEVQIRDGYLQAQLGI